MVRKSAYDYRRYIFLVQFIATFPTESQVCDLCDKWNVEPHIIYKFAYPVYDKWGLDKELDYDTTYSRLAESVIAHDRHNNSR